MFESSAAWSELSEPVSIYHSGNNEADDSSFAEENYITTLQKKFGRADLAEVYSKAKRLVIDNKLLRLFQYQEDEESKTLIICNHWRVIRTVSGAFEMHEHNLLSGEWVKADDFTDWPYMPFLKPELHWWEGIIKKVLWIALNHAGYPDLPFVDVNKGHMSRRKMAELFVAGCLGSYKSRSIHRKTKKSHGLSETVFVSGFLNQKLMKGAAAALREVFFKHFIDKEIWSAMMAIDYKYIPFHKYLLCAANRDGFLKVAREHRNLLPLLDSIEPRYWGLDDLFSRRVWVASDRSTVLPDIVNKWKAEDLVDVFGPEKGRLIGFDNPAAWKWITKASPVTLREWEVGYNTLITHLALTNISVKVPVCVYVVVLRSLSRRLCKLWHNWEEQHPQTDFVRLSQLVQRLLRLFILFCVKVWKDEGYKSLARAKDGFSCQLTDVFDYLSARGFEQGFPQKNSTWGSLLARAREWEEQGRRRQDVETLTPKSQLMVSWDNIVPETIINGVNFIPLSNNHELNNEGDEMWHCVGDYADMCMTGHYRVYAVTDGNGTRSTLGFLLHQGKYVFDQCRTYRNDRAYGPPSDVVIKASKKLIALYNKKLKEQATLDGDNYDQE